MDAETVVQNDCSRFGLRVVHVMRVGAPVECDRWVGLVPGVAWDSMHMYRRREGGKLGIHHLYLMWQAREAVRMQVLDHPPFNAVAWSLEKGQRLRDAAITAAWEFWLRFEQNADTAWVRSLPQGADDGATIKADGQTLNLRKVDWGIERFVIVGLAKEAPNGKTTA